MVTASALEVIAVCLSCFLFGFVLNGVIWKK